MLSVRAFIQLGNNIKADVSIGYIKPVYEYFGTFPSGLSDHRVHFYLF